MKRILLLSFYHPPDVTPGAFRIKSILKELARNNNEDLEIDLITTEPNRYTSFNKDYKSTEDTEDYPPYVKVHKIKIPQNHNKLSLQIIGFIIYAFGAIKFASKKKWDLIFATSSRLMTAFLSALIAKFKNVDLFLDIRDLFSDTAHHVFSGFFLNAIFPFIKLIESWTFKNANHINIVSPGFYSFIKKINPRASIYEHTNGVDEIFLKHDFADNVIRNERLKILYAGNIGACQNLESVIPQIAKKTESFADFFVIGDGGRKTKLIEEANKLRCKNLKITGHVSREELINHYTEANILFLNLSELDCFKRVLPSKMFEYGATGKPILAGVTGSAEKFLRSNVPWAYIFAPSSVSACLESLEHLRKELKIYDARDFKQKFSRKEISSQLANRIIHIVFD